MVGTEPLLINRQRAPIERLGLGVASLVLIEQGQVVEGRRHIGMIGAEIFFWMISDILEGVGSPPCLI